MTREEFTQEMNRQVKLVRAEYGFTQDVMARVLGLSKKTLIEIEKGRSSLGWMGGIIRSVANYRNYENVLGFSFRYYSTQMVRNNEIRLLALNGIEPNKDTIRDGSYPIASEFFAVTASKIGEPAPEESDIRMKNFLNWILSEQGQYIVEETGYVAVR